MKHTISITDNKTGKTIELPVLHGSAGSPAVDIRTLQRELGLLTYDPGFLVTASCRSKITYIDGEKGILQYRGYPIETLAEKSNFMEVAYLLLHGELPLQGKLDDFVSVIRHHTMINESLKRFYDGFYYNAHPMSVMVGVVGSMSSFYHDSTNILNPQHREIAAHRLIAKIPTIAAASYKHSIGEPFIYPRNDLGYCANLLHMMFAVPCEDYEVDSVASRALNMVFMLHMDHEQNASTSTVRLTGSSGADPFACIAAGIAALWGPAHGGANEAVLGMLEEIGEAKNIGKFLDKAKDKTDPFRLMGFGHRIYKNYDPRARVLRGMCHELLDKLGNSNDPLFELAMKLEEHALNDEYFIQRKLYPNVDFYSGLIYKALGIPTNMFTVMFAIARTVGWVAQWTEMITDPEQKIGRPHQVYEGCIDREFINIEQRN